MDVTRACRWLDVTHTLDEHAPVYPGDTGFSRRVTACIATDGYACEVYSCGGGVATHIDSPAHFGFPQSVDEIPLERLVARPLVILEAATWQHGTDAVQCGSVVFYRTRWCVRWPTAAYVNDAWPAFPLALARLCVDRGVYGVGIDTLSLDAHDAAPAYPVHRLVLGAGLYQLENLKLDWDDAGPHKPPARGASVYVLPSKVRGAPEAPCRVVVMY